MEAWHSCLNTIWYTYEVARIKFSEGDQRRFFSTLFERSGLSARGIAAKVGVSARTIRDWKREKIYANYEIIISLAREYRIPLPRHDRLEERWHLAEAASLGGTARYKLYGSTTTIEDRQRGGKISQARRRADPEKYRLLGCNVRKIFKKPKYSVELAEIIGIILGDGCLSDYQVIVTLDRKVDYDYAFFVSDLLCRVFGEKPAWSERESVIELKLSGANLIDLLEELGLERGNKIKHQVAIPSWIFSNREFQYACMRGLFDTDGGIYKHQKLKAVYIGWAFTSYSQPLIMGVERILKSIPLRYSVTYGKQVFIYSLDTILKYMALVGSSNPKNVEKVRVHIKRRGVPNGKVLAWKASGLTPLQVRVLSSPQS